MSPLLSIARIATRTPEGAARRRRRGFTLIELLVVIAVAAILAGLSASSISKMFQSNRVQTEAGGFVSDLMFARSEAIKRGQGVSLCASSNGSTCLNANTWQSGWIVFLDTNQCNPVPSASTAVIVLRQRAAFKGTDTLVATTPTNTTCVNFNRDGFSSNLGTTQAIFTLHTATSSALTTRCVSVDLGGRIATQTTSTSTSCL